MLSRRLVHRHRALARVALYLVPLVFFGVLWSYLRRLPRPAFSPSELRRELPDLEEVRLFRDYLRVDTSAPAGDEVRGAELLARFLAGEGIASELIRTGPRHANLWALLEGEDPSAVVLHNHIDVDPIRPEEHWTVDPFGAEYRAPWIYGRGAFDMKSVAIAQIVAFVELKRRGTPPARSVAFLATGDEENGSWHGTRWLLASRPDLVSRLGVVLTEGGAVEALDSETVKYWGTEVCQKRFIEVVVCDRSRERLEALAAAIAPPVEGVGVDLAPTARFLAPEVKAFLGVYAPTRDLALHRELMADPEAMVAGDDFYRLPQYVKAMLRNEIAVFPVSTAEGGGGFELRLILHLPPGEADAHALGELLPPGLVAGFAVRVEAPPAGPTCSPVDHPVFQAIDAFMRDRHPRWRHGPLVVPLAATDARFFRAAGIPAFGFSPFVFVSSDTRRMSSANERLAAPAFIDGVALYRALVADLAGASEEAAKE